MTPNEIRIEFFKLFEFLDIGAGTNSDGIFRHVMISSTPFAYLDAVEYFVVV